MEVQHPTVLRNLPTGRGGLRLQDLTEGQQLLMTSRSANYTLAGSPSTLMSTSHVLYIRVKLKGAAYQQTADNTAARSESAGRTVLLEAGRRRDLPAAWR